MADLQEELQRFLTARFGVDVKDAFVSCIQKIHKENQNVAALEQPMKDATQQVLDIREEDLKRPIETLSHRCQLNVALYKWIIAKARLIVIDNLFSGTDILMRNSVREFLEFAKGRGIGVVYCSPNESELSSVCDRLYELAEGKVSCK